MTDEEITGVVTSIESLTDQFTPKDIRIISHVSVVRNQPQKCAQEVAGILTSIMVLKDQLTPGDIKNLYRILAAHGQPPKCSSCGRELTDFRCFSWDHVFAKSIGGPDDIKNMTPMCTTCNVEKGSQIKEECFCHVESVMLQQLKAKYNIQPERTKKQKTGKPRGLTLSGKRNERKEPRRNHIRMNGWCDGCLSFHR